MSGDEPLITPWKEFLLSINQHFTQSQSEWWLRTNRSNNDVSSTLKINPLNPKGEREREEKVGGGQRYALLLTGRGGHKFVFAATKVPRQCPLVLLVKVGLVKVRRLEVEKVRWRVEQGEKLSRVLLRSYTI
jgi:hypothetical protein